MPTGGFAPGMAVAGSFVARFTDRRGASVMLPGAFANSALLVVIIMLNA
jgi:hypothetical protein